VKRGRIIAGTLGLLVFIGIAYLTLLSFGMFASANDFPPVPPGHREIIFLAPATSGDAWDRFIAAVDSLCKPETQRGGRPLLHVSKERAFTDLTADVPEISIWLDGCEDARLWVRWCKLSADSNTPKWIARLTQRPPPLAIIGGDTSTRAQKVAEALEHHRGDWKGPPPLLFITTATVDRFVPNNTPNVSTTDEKLPQLIDVYKGHSFRFSFSNSRIAAVLLDFVQSHDELWLNAPQRVDAAAVCTAARDPLAAAALAVAGDELMASYLYTLTWADDSFSVDLADRFRAIFLANFPRPRVSPYQIEYSVGDFYQPNPREAFVVGQLIPELKATRDRRQLLLLPADAERARRFLRTVVRRSAPRDLKNLLVVRTCGSLGFNTLLRDRNVSWNIQDLPVPLAAFSHRNPVDEDVGFKEQAAPADTGTEDLLLYRDILEALTLTAYQGRQLTASSDDLAQSLHGLSWADGHVQAVPPGGRVLPLFKPASGNRMNGTGEFVIVLKPDADDRGLLAQATITIWRLDSSIPDHPIWRKQRTLNVTYDDL